MDKHTHFNGCGTQKAQVILNIFSTRILVSSCETLFTLGSKSACVSFVLHFHFNTFLGYIFTS